MTQQLSGTITSLILKTRQSGLKTRNRVSHTVHSLNRQPILGHSTSENNEKQKAHITFIDE